MTLRMRDRENMEKGLVAGMEKGLAAGRKEGLQEGLAAGMEKGRTAGRAESIIELLEDVGEISPQLKERIYVEQDVDKLKTWLHLAKRADTVEEFQKKM